MVATAEFDESSELKRKGSLSDEGESPNDSGNRAKRRRSRKGLEKQYACDEPNCGKKFTRLEHLYRHQLNHKPKEIFHCTWPGARRPLFAKI